MIDFGRSLFENSRKRPLICAHRGSASGNIPCNTPAAFTAALMQGADMIELDVAVSADGGHFVFHPGMESPHLGIERRLREMTSEEIRDLRFRNPDGLPTQFGLSRLADAFEQLRGKCYINVDKFWTDVPGISRVIRDCGVQDQVVVKTGTAPSDLCQVKEFASDFMFLPVIRGKDTVTDRRTEEGVRCVGAEVLFRTLDEDCCSEAYLRRMHERGKILFVNAEVYDIRSVISAGLTDDTSLTEGPDAGWGRLADMGFDIIQTDWAGLLKAYLEAGPRKAGSSVRQRPPGKQQG